MTISAILTAPMGVLAQPTEIDGYMASARGLLPSVQLLASSSPEHSRALALLGGFLVECALKAFLSRKGLTAKELRNPPRGHDLEALWVEAVKYGLSLDPSPPQWCFVLNCLHFENNENKQNGVKVLYQLRYQSEVHGLSFPVTGDMLVGLQSVVQTVEQALING